jgi:hypothetical protein
MKITVFLIWSSGAIVFILWELNLFFSSTLSPKRHAQGETLDFSTKTASSTQPRKEPALCSGALQSDCPPPTPVPVFKLSQCPHPNSVTYNSFLLLHNVPTSQVLLDWRWSHCHMPQGLRPPWEPLGWMSVCSPCHSDTTNSQAISLERGSKEGWTFPDHC